MIPFLLASTFSCSEAEDLIKKFNSRGVSDETKVELIEVAKANTEPGCWDAND